MCGCSDMAMSIPKKTWKSRQQQTLYGIMTLRSHHISLTKSRRMIRRLTALSVVLILSVACEHKPFCWHHPHDGMLRVEFAWWDAPEAEYTVRSMAFYAIPKRGQGETFRLRRLQRRYDKSSCWRLPFPMPQLRYGNIHFQRRGVAQDIYHPYPRQLYTRRNGYKSRRRWRLLRG